ncbi:MAG: PQQ-binding-like beta-propeller repeat protein, partial [Candidatus Thermoplasmatota archaeon]|nr:PQQ-binding-like beta-propeller repeat protein [Candidatus Thermoplasmatota archaeon]
MKYIIYSKKIYVIGIIFIILVLITPDVLGSLYTPFSIDSADVALDGHLLNKTTCITVSAGPMDSAWPMHSHDRRHTGRSPYNTSDNPGVEKWRCVTEHVLCTPVIADDGTIYTQGGYDDITDYLLSIDPNGYIKWRYEASGTMWFCSPAIADDGTVYVGCWDCKIYALYPNGTLKWKIGIGGTPSSLTIDDSGIIYTSTMKGFNEGEIIALYPNGTIKWRYETGYYNTGVPAIADDGTIYCGSGDYYFYALYPNGTLKWKYKTGDVIKGPASIDTDGTIYVGSFDDNLYAFYPNGTVKWKIRLDVGTETNPSIGPDGTIYVGSDKLYAINPNGTIKWALSLGQYYSITQSSPAISADGIVYVGATYLETK